jgi:hypothetical protein
MFVDDVLAEVAPSLGPRAAIVAGGRLDPGAPGRPIRTGMHGGKQRGIVEIRIQFLPAPDLFHKFYRTPRGGSCPDPPVSDVPQFPTDGVARG